MSDTKPKRSKKMIFFKSIILLFAGIGLAITILGVVLSRDEISQRWDNFWADIPTWEDVFNQEASGSPAPTPSTSPATPAPTAAPTPVVTPAPAPTPEITPAPSVKPGYIPPPTDAQRCSSTKFDLAGHTSLAEISLGGPNHLQFYWFTGDPEKTTLVPAGMEHQIFAKTLLGANWAYTPACTEEYVRAQITASTPLRKADTVIADPYFMEWQISGLYN